MRSRSVGDAPRIRPLCAADLPRVLEIEAEAYSVPWRRDTFGGLLRRTDTDLLAAERNGRVIGYAVCWTVLDQAELGNVAVAGEVRGRGVGRLLLGAVFRRLRERGARECFLEVRVSNAPAQALYRQQGFDVVGHRPRYYTDPPEDALVMRRSLGERA